MIGRRINFIDISRAFAIIFIVIGHTLVHSTHCNNIFKFLYSFNVMFFFILSGYTFKIKYSENFLIFLKKKFIRIMVPYFVWSLVFLIPYMILGNKVGATLGTSSSFNLKHQLINILYGNGNLSALKQNSSLWFLPALFSMEIVYYIIIKYTDKLKNKAILVLFFTLFIGYITSNYISAILPWGINTVLNIGSFFYIGYMLKNYNIEKNIKILKKWYYIIILFIMGLVACFLNNQTVACIDYRYGKFALMLISGVSLSIVCIYISYIINKNIILEYVGKNTMGILIFHKLIVLIFQTKLGKISMLLSNSNICIEFVICLVITLISIIISLFITKILKKFLPFTIGEVNK